MRPLILISNDDGIQSPYLTELADAVEELGEVWVAAPEKPRSAMSHSITLHKPLRVKEVSERRFAISGTPVDCVYVGVIKLVPRTPALVISGINAGYNLGTDVFYSGTVAAAVEGGLRGVPSLAFSTEPRVSDFSSIVGFASRVVKGALDSNMTGVVNVNIPPAFDDRYQWTRLGKRFYGDDVHERTDPRGGKYYWIGGGQIGMGKDAGTDCAATEANIASLTPLSLDRTDRSEAAPWQPEGLSPVGENA